MCYTWLDENKGCKNSPSGHHWTTLSGCIFATKACIDNRKKLVKQQYLFHMSPQYANFGPLAAEIVSLVWGTPGNFNMFCVLAALLHGTLVVVVSQTAALNRGRHVYSAGRPSRWTLAHISSSVLHYTSARAQRPILTISRAYHMTRFRARRCFCAYRYATMLHQKKQQ